MRTSVLVIVYAVAAAACSEKAPRAPATPLVAVMPRVAAAEALAPAAVEVPRVVAFLAADGGVTANDRAAVTWETFVAGDPRTQAAPVTVAALRSLVEGELPPPDAAIDAADDEDDGEDDGEEESGGTVVNVNLDEMPAKVDWERREEEERRRRADPEVQRQEGRARVRVGEARAGTAGELPIPRRAADVLGETLFEPLPAVMPELLVVAHPAAKATALVDVLVASRALLAVAHEEHVRAWRVAFVARPPYGAEDWAPWMEVRVAAGALEVEAVPGEPIRLAGPVDPAALGAAFTRAREARRLTGRVDVDVLVEPDVDTQRLVDDVAALDAAGARFFGVGRAPIAGSDELARRGKRIPVVRYGVPSRHGGLERQELLEVLATARPAITACYEAALEKDPELGGVVASQFFIAPTGKIANLASSGVEPGLAACVASAIRALEFPRPRGGGGVQVTMPFLLSR